MPRYFVPLTVIALGGGVGAASAWLSTRYPEEHGKAAPPALASSGLGSVRVARAATPTPSLTPATPASTMPGAKLEAPSALGASGLMKLPTLTREALEQATLHCAWGAPGDCLRVARAYSSGTPNDARRARAFRQLAAGTYARECRARDPVACQALSRMYEAGEGVKFDRVQAKALLVRAAELCRIRPQPVCTQLQSPAAKLR
jgi:TPR repeat protein